MRTTQIDQILKQAELSAVGLGTWVVGPAARACRTHRAEHGGPTDQRETPAEVTGHCVPATLRVTHTMTGKQRLQLYLVQLKTNPPTYSIFFTPYNQSFFTVTKKKNISKPSSSDAQGLTQRKPLCLWRVIPLPINFLCRNTGWLLNSFPRGTKVPSWRRT